MDRIRHFALMIVGLGMAGAFAAACDSGTQAPAPETAATPQTAAQATAGGAAPDVIAKERFPELQPGVKAEVPEDFLDDVAIYPGAVPAQGKGRSVDGSPLAAVQLMTLDAPEKVYSFYVDSLESDGWTIEDREGFSERNAITASKDNCTASMLAAPTADGGSDIFLITECSS